MNAAAAIVALPVASLVIWLTLRSRFTTRILAAPSDDRWHDRATPALGGLGIFLGLLSGSLGALAAGAVSANAELLGILGGCAVLFAAGFLDDVLSLRPLTKVAAQLAAAAIALGSGIRVEIVHNPVLATAIGVVWLVGMTNAFNLLDNMDGLAATLAAIACAYFAIDAVTVHPSRTVLVLSLSAGLACVGFLPFNVRPGKSAAIFMGDSGSQVLGFALAALGLSASWKVAGTTVATLLLPILVLAVPILDTTLVMIVRLLEGRPITQGGRDHTSHRLVYQGLSERRALVLLAVVAAALGATSLTYNVLDNGRLTIVGVLLTFVLLVQFGSYLAEVERDKASTRRVLRPLVLHRRRLVEVVVDFALISAAFSGAYLLGIEGGGSDYQRHIFYVTLPVVLFARYVAFIPFGLYRGVWRYAGARDATAVIGAVVVSEVVAWAFVGLTHPWGDFPQSVLVIDALLCTVLVGASRFGERALFRAFAIFRERGTRRRTLIVGAGRSGRSLLRELRETPGEQVVGFLDDDLRLRGRRLQGVPVVGGCLEVEAALASIRPEAVLVTIPSAPRERLDAVVRGCAAAGVPCRFVRREVDVEPATVLQVAAK